MGLETEISRINSLEENLSNNWESDVSRAFLSKLKSTKNQIQKLNGEISEIARDIERIARRIKKEDEEQEKIALSLSKGN
jgi:uncharacterized protein YukE